ncbi:putative NADH dehydrogenase [Lachnellula occidentalis]|uniref:Putative NADH dehydrogenase n=1 Tax=Lachnellula occidentalis TaxID=215460 RepID=A0A8H8UJ58_9HELO|nr:putative NADH dehydrogenase [Lachnellula occidentalis]
MAGGSAKTGWDGEWKAYYELAALFEEWLKCNTTPHPPQQQQTDPRHPRHRLGGWTLSQELGSQKSPLAQTHNILVLSPSRTMALTPLLASAACSIFDFRIAEEPVRRSSLSPALQKYQVHVLGVDFKQRSIRCVAAVGSNGDDRAPDLEGQEPVDGAEEFEVGYDTLIMAPGSETNTFGTPGVPEHCYSMKSMKDAMKLRERILDCLELASLPIYTEAQKRDLLHFAIVGGGPTGVELAAEIDELVHDHLAHVYKSLAGMVTVSVYDVADRMLGSFGEKLSQYAMERFRKRHVQVRMGRHIEGVEKGVLKIKEDGRVGFGVCVWAAGNKASALVQGMDVRKSEGGMERVLTDRWLRVLATPDKKSDEGDEALVKGVYALGDAADIAGHTLPTTAEVAVQKAKWLARHLNAGEPPDGEPFSYHQKSMVAYIGREDGVVEGKQDWTGASAWLAWRGGSLQWTRSWRRRAMICIYWFMNKLDGREIARR